MKEKPYIVRTGRHSRTVVGRHVARGVQAVILAALFLMAATPPAAAEGSAEGAVAGRPLPSASPTSSGIDVSGRAGDVESVSVTGSSGPYVERTLALDWPLVCVSGTRSEVRTMTRNRRLVRIKVVREESGCRGESRSGYRFDPAGWRARAWGSIPTKVRTFTYEKRNGRWYRVASNESSSRATLDLTWTGRGTPRPDYAVYPFICLPPAVCFYATAVVYRDAAVDGSVTFGGLGRTATLRAAAGTMHWGAP